MPNYLNKVVYLTDTQYATLIANHNTAIGGHKYDPDTLYITNTSGDASTVNGHTLGIDVPADAIFTDHYHTSGTWDGLTYTAQSVNGAGPSAFTVPNINNTAVADLGWASPSSSTANVRLITLNTLAYWDGRYQTNNNASNLKYCNQGQFGTIITTNYPTSNTAAVFLRGDKTWSSTLGASLTISKAAECGIEVVNSQTTNPHSGLFGVGSSGNLGIYDRTKSKWVVYSDPSGNVVLNGNANTATTATKLSNTSAIGSDVKPVYFTSGGVPQATATEMLRGFTTTSAGTDLNTMYDSGTYSITGGTLTNYPTGGSTYATILTVAYRKPSGNTKPDYAWQMGNFTQDSDKMWYRTSQSSAWRAWRQIVNIATNTGVGNSTTPVYVDANGSVQSCTSYANATVGNATKVAAKLATTTKTYLLGTSTTITDTATNVDLIGDTSVYLNTTAGSLSAKYYQINDGTTEKVTLQWNAIDESLDFIFA